MTHVTSRAAPRALRAFLAGLALLAAAACTAQAAPSGARNFLQTYSSQAIDTLAARDVGEAARKESFRELLKQGFALPEIGRFVLGKYARAASETQFDRFLEAFAAILARRYAPMFEGASERQVRIGDARPVDGRDDLFMVESTVVLTDGSPAKVFWRVKNTEAGYRVMDVAAEGVSMAITLRDEYGEVLRSGGVDTLTERLREIAARPQ
jgi:phospholipid transport system substrate-binding protein